MPRGLRASPSGWAGGGAIATVAVRSIEKARGRFDSHWVAGAYSHPRRGILPGRVARGSVFLRKAACQPRRAASLIWSKVANARATTNCSRTTEGKAPGTTLTGASRVRG
jgi:hypothetical protein